MSKIIGIDLGTTNSCVSIMEGKQAKVIENAEAFLKPSGTLGVKVTEREPVFFRAHEQGLDPLQKPLQRVL